jgi:ssDNA-binding Zn-finger/Zn-ribbon topoisomerase 1
MQPRKDSTPSVRICPACGHPQTKIQRVTGGATVYVCARADDCSVGVSLSKIANWVAV